jgi:hypothetical protein
LPDESVGMNLHHFEQEGASYRVSTSRCDSTLAIGYEILIHVDRVIDFLPRPDSPEHRMIDSLIIGQPDEELEEEWPKRHNFLWRLGVPDGEGQRSSEHRHVSVHDRLGGRDRSTPRRGGVAPVGYM